MGKKGINPPPPSPPTARQANQVLWIYFGPTARKYRIRYTRNAYRPDHYPETIPEESREAIILCTGEESVRDVLDYHYPGKYKDLEILTVIEGK